MLEHICKDAMNGATGIWKQQTWATALRTVPCLISIRTAPASVKPRISANRAQCHAQIVRAWHGIPQLSIRFHQNKRCPSIQVMDKQLKLSISRIRMTSGASAGNSAKTTCLACRCTMSGDPFMESLEPMKFHELSVDIATHATHRYVHAALLPCHGSHRFLFKISSTASNSQRQLQHVIHCFGSRRCGNRYVE